jgi:aminocarboxymuconate-semialdehyde decarboxylase
MKKTKVDYPIIDGHGHILPEPSQIPKSISKAGYFNVITSTLGQWMTQDFIGWRRPVSHGTFFKEPRLEWMEKHNIAHTILITLSQLYCNGIADDEAALDIMRFQNDFHVSLQEKHPLRFSCGFVGLPRLLDVTLIEMQRRYKEGLKFLCLPTHYKRSDGQYISCTDENCQRIFALANELSLPIQFHPYDYEEIYNLADIDTNWAGHKSPMPALTAHLFDRLITEGLHEKYPNVRFYFSHGNSVGLATIGRQQQAWLARPDLRKEGSKGPIEALSAKNIFVDSIVHDPDLIWLLKQKIGTSQIIHGIDSPYPLGDGIDYLDDGVYPGSTLDSAENEGYITAAEKRAMFQDNVFSWLYGKDDAKGKNMKQHIFSS